MWLGLPYWQRQVVTGQAAAQNPAERSSRAPCPFRPAAASCCRQGSASRSAHLFLLLGRHLSVAAGEERRQAGTQVEGKAAVMAGGMGAPLPAYVFHILPSGCMISFAL